MLIKNDKKLDIATGNSRKAKTWKNKPVQWSELLDRMATPTRTAETVAEYKALSRDQQSNIKDVGGFVGGYCEHGSRSDVRFRSVLCLDADYADAELWSDWQLAYGNAAAVYSTHKHTPNKPRLRLVIPLARNVTPDEYQAVGRRVAATLGIDKFDDTTYQPQRVMFWPSCSQDGEYIFEHQDGPMLDPDKLLATYHNWADVSSWPLSSRVAEIVKRSAATAGDPLDKPGLIGAFCRAYTIQEAIAEFIPTYQPCTEPNRYTYTEGSTAAGVVIYTDKWSYSHHATDPASMQLCNAWDLVRLHQFGAMDIDCAPDVKVNARPSYKAMGQLASNDDRVKAQLVADRMAEANEDYAEELPADKDWRSLLKVTERGSIAQTIENVVTILQHDPQLAGKIALNLMEHNIVAIKKLPWGEKKAPRQWTDADDSALRYYLERTYGMSGKDKIFDAVNVTAQQAAFHPVREYLDKCTWDGVERIDTLLVDYLGAEDTDYTRAVTRKALTAAVARIYRPGCKFDYMLTIRGRQGIGKSALIGKLGGAWYSDSFTTMQGKDAYEQVLGVWLMEVGELAGMRKAEAETIKLFISKQSDRFRPAYGRRIQDFPRQCVFIATTNETQFLRDTTGNRRFWVVDTPAEPNKNLFEDLTPETVKLIWGEAVERYNAKEPLYLPPALERRAREIQEDYEEENPKAGVVESYLARDLPEDWYDMDIYARRNWLDSGAVGTEPRRAVCTMEIWAEALNGNPERMDRYASKEIRDIMARLPNWRRAVDREYLPPYGSQRYYKRMKAKDVRERD